MSWQQNLRRIAVTISIRPKFQKKVYFRQRHAIWNCILHNFPRLLKIYAGHPVSHSILYNIYECLILKQIKPPELNVNILFLFNGDRPRNKSNKFTIHNCTWIWKEKKINIHFPFYLWHRAIHATLLLLSNIWLLSRRYSLSQLLKRNNVIFPHNVVIYIESSFLFAVS